jgi:hypothetical protein
MRLAADDVQSLVVPSIGHWLAEEAPEQVLAALTAFADRTAAGEREGRVRSSGGGWWTA